MQHLKYFTKLHLFTLRGIRLRRDSCVSVMYAKELHSTTSSVTLWEHHVAHTRCARRKAKMRQALEAAHIAFGPHATTQCLPPQALKEWHEWATDRVSAFHRASSAVEGRNDYRDQVHRNQRGLPKHRDKVWTVVHNFDYRTADGTTPACRLFRRTFPDLFRNGFIPYRGLTSGSATPTRGRAKSLTGMKCPALSGYSKYRFWERADCYRRRVQPWSLWDKHSTLMVRHSSAALFFYQRFYFLHKDIHRGEQLLQALTAIEINLKGL